MENVNIILAANILKYRKKSGLSQDELAQKLGVTFQAVSKWENAKAAPDITFLPTMADIFGCYIDELFSREVKTEIHYDHCAEFPWCDDTVIRGVVCEGRKILQCDELFDRFTFEIVGDAQNVHSECNIEVNGNVLNGCEASKSVTVNGCVSGGINSFGDVVVGGTLSGGCNASGNVTVSGHFSGGCNTTGNIACGGNLHGDASCNGTLTVQGNVEAEKIKGTDKTEIVFGCCRKDYDDIIAKIDVEKCIVKTLLY